MYKLELLIFFLIIFSLDSWGFDVDQFKKQFCTESPEKSNFYCNGANLTASQIKDIQEKDFIISNCSHIVFQSAELGVVNGHFFEKFPLAETIRLSYSTFNLTSSSSTIDDLTNLKKLVFRLCTVGNISDSKAFDSLVNLESLIMELYLYENSTITEKLLKKNRKIRFLEIVAYKGRLDLSENVLNSLNDLRELNLRFLGNLSSNLLKSNKNVESLIISSDVMKRFPEDMFIPETVKLLHLNDLKIQNISRKHFEKLKSLRVLNLSSNNIKIFDVDTFKDLEDLTTLTMSSNKLIHITSAHFAHMKKLRKLDLRYNYLDNDKEDIQNLNNTIEHLNLLIEPQYTNE